MKIRMWFECGACGTCNHLEQSVVEADMVVKVGTSSAISQRCHRVRQFRADRSRQLEKIRRFVQGVKSSRNFLISTVSTDLGTQGPAMLRSLLPSEEQLKVLCELENSILSMKSICKPSPGLYGLDLFKPSRLSTFAKATGTRTILRRRVRTVEVIEIRPSPFLTSGSKLVTQRLKIRMDCDAEMEHVVVAVHADSRIVLYLLVPRKCSLVHEELNAR